MPNQNGDLLSKDYYTAYFDLEGADEQEGAPEPRFSVAELMHHLIDQSETVTGLDLFVLSDLSRQNMELVRRDWLLIPVTARRRLVRSLIEFAMEDVEWHLGRLLRIALEDPDAEVRQSAIKGLWEDTGSDLVGPLVQILHNDRDNQVRAAAANTLGGFVLAGELDEIDTALAMRAEEALLAVLHNPSEVVTVQASALESIAYSGETGVRQLIEDGYYSPDEELRVGALVAMGRSADIRWRGLVRAELQNPSPLMRAEAARACGELEARKAEREILQLLLDDVQDVQLAAIFALGRLGGNDARRALRALAEGEDEVLAEAADVALEEMLFFGDREGVSLHEDDDNDLDAGDYDPWESADDFDEDDLGSYDE
ncbi:MAG: HEAT repeat domain-containing protein [Caldilineaceae bacterium]